MKYIMCSRTFPKEHPKAGQFTHFVEKIWNSFRLSDWSLPESMSEYVLRYMPLLSGEQYLQSCAVRDIKLTTIRSGSRFKPGDMASLRVWSDKPYRSKQIEFAQVEVKKVWDFCISDGNYSINSIQIGSFIPDRELAVIANNDGLQVDDFWSWFSIHPKKKENVFTGQVICWSNEINY